MNKKIKGIALALSAVAVGAASTWQGLSVARYSIPSIKLNSRIRAVVVSDLHSTRYGASQNRLIDKIVSEKPDLILLSGDIVDERRDPAPAFTLLKQLVRIAPTFMVTGNHEYYGGRADDIIREISSFGIRILFGEAEELTVNGESITVCGLEDPYDITEEEYLLQRKALINGIDHEKLSILISHRPELVEFYEEIGADITVCGHAHGGQVIIPGLVNGLYAPHQGLFPKYAGGIYHLEKTVMVVCRGLMKSIVPRVFNPPELCVIDLVGCPAPDGTEVAK